MKPIKDFEQDYALTDKGQIVDLHTGKVKVTHTKGDIPDLRVDLYKDGILITNIRVIELILKQYFDVTTIAHYEITYLDGDSNNLSLDNIRIVNKPNSYVAKISKPKPQKIYKLTLDGAVVINKSDIDKVIEINSQASLERGKHKKRISGKKYQKFLLGK